MLKNLLFACSICMAVQLPMRAQSLEVQSATFLDSNGQPYTVQYGNPVATSNGYIQQPISPSLQGYNPAGNPQSGTTYGAGTLDSYATNPYSSPTSSGYIPPRQSAYPNQTGAVLDSAGFYAGSQVLPPALQSLSTGGGVIAPSPAPSAAAESFGRPPAAVGGSPAGEPGDARFDTAGSGDTGSSWDNAPTSDVTMTQNNNPSQFYIPPPDGTHTQTTRQSLYQGLTKQNTGNRLLAPLATMQYGDTRSFKGPYDLGFPSPKGVAFSTNAMGYNNPFGFGPGIPFVPIGLPTTGTPSVNADITIGGGY